jgi:hypothetical protein
MNRKARGEFLSRITVPSFRQVERIQIDNFIFHEKMAQ